MGAKSREIASNHFIHDPNISDVVGQSVEIRGNVGVIELFYHNPGTLLKVLDYIRLHKYYPFSFWADQYGDCTEFDVENEKELNERYDDMIGEFSHHDCHIKTINN